MTDTPLNMQRRVFDSLQQHLLLCLIYTSNSLLVPMVGNSRKEESFLSLAHSVFLTKAGSTERIYCANKMKCMSVVAELLCNKSLKNQKILTAIIES